MAQPSVGAAAPDFALTGTPGPREYRLSDYRGQVVVLAFYPADNTPVCTTQLTSYEADLGQFTEFDAQLLAISPQSLESHEAFAAKNGLTLPLLADEDKGVGRSYGILGPVGFYRRSVFVVDPGGVVRYAHRATAGLTFRKTPELLAAVRDAAR